MSIDLTHQLFTDIVNDVPMESGYALSIQDCMDLRFYHESGHSLRTVHYAISKEKNEDGEFELVFNVWLDDDLLGEACIAK